MVYLLLLLLSFFFFFLSFKKNIVLARKGAPTFSPSTWDAAAGGSEFKARLVYTASSGQLRLCRRNPVSKK